MRYKRHESFRYQFNEHIEAEFTFNQQDDHSTISSQKGKAYVHDISPNGLRFHSEFDLPINANHSSLILEFILNEENMSLPGQIIWKKKLATSFLYGFKGNDSTDSKQRIIELLKKHSRQNKQ
ncbi:PilZ domain-containing protein [Bacillus sp. B1-b2]|uniref:PilZ domain-containing protein n=1 Tax=Bacillus sp. B1-b2 TaxID=2653201 RepID=UPI00126249FC|nr:PilZ domain-containing protein [Bacillus sp. B1-b2]KAB7669335.1 PilZ domain-containing protein [Bacillus sp. B1-b2]